ncbi:MAG: hypothetical protein Q8R02_19585 [Hyphomonadaceae bacterium]|nr:hypothetical protein [Hyphomonadaceae bacterium]
MNPVTRYVKEVEKNLSGMRRIQTSAKIYKVLSIKVDGLEAKLGREPTDAEMEALLAEFGAPADVAASYSAMGAPMHDLVERYLAAVRRRLPEKQAKDIAAELRDGIAGKIEAKEEALGHAASADDVAAILKEFGHPVVVASRYSGRDYLIGPNLYPWFWDAQRVGVGLVFALVMVITAVKALKSERAMAMVITGIGGAIEAAIWMFGVITVVFIVMERTRTDVRIARGWNPKALPQDHIRKPRPLFDTLFALAFDTIFILWWIKVVDFPNDIPGRGNSMELHFAEAWASMHTPILALALLMAAVHVSDIVHPAWSRLRSAVSILGHVGGIAVLWVLGRSGPLVSVTAATEESTRAAELAGSINAVFGYSLAIVGLFWAIGIGVEVWRQVKAMRPTSPHAGVAA